MNKLTSLRLISTVLVLTAVLSRSAFCADSSEQYTPFTGEKSGWHDGFERYDYLMDDETLEIQPFRRGEGENFGIADPPPGKHRCVVVVPKQPAAGNPWSWQGCYWDHQPQAEVELLHRGFHIAYISANGNLKPGKQWEAWYAYLTEKHGLSKKPAFIGMSRGGEYAYTWATTHPTQVSCIYADNPGVNPDVLKKLGDLAAADVPILHVCGSIDPLLGRSSNVIETIYRQFGGRISVMIKEGAGHHPHSLRDPKPIADFMVQAVQPAEQTPPPNFLGNKPSRTLFGGIENSYRYFPREQNYITRRGPLFSESFDRYTFELAGIQGAITVVAPQNRRGPSPFPMPGEEKGTVPLSAAGSRTATSGRPWVFRADGVNQGSAVDLALLAKGFHIVTGPVPYNGDGPILDNWNAVYKHLVDHGFSTKPVMEGAGGAAGEVYAWAIANPDKVSCIYAENPVLHCTMTKEQPLDNLAPLAKAGVSIMHVCGALDPQLSANTDEAEKRYKKLGGTLTVIRQEGVGHFPTAPNDTGPVVDFILARQGRANSER